MVDNESRLVKNSCSVETTIKGMLGKKGPHKTANY